MTLQFFNLKPQNKSEKGSIIFFDLVIDNNIVNKNELNNLKLCDKTYIKKFFERCSHKLAFDKDENIVKENLIKILNKKKNAGYQKFNIYNKDDYNIKKFFITLDDYKNFSNTNLDYIILDKFRHDEDFIEKYTLFYFKDKPDICNQVYNQVYDQVYN